MSASIRRILIVRTDRLGDVILTLPVLAALRRCFPGAHLAMLLRRYTGEIVEGNPNCDEMIWYDRSSERVPFQEMLGIIRGGRFDAAVVVHPRLRLALLAALAGIPIRIGSGYRAYSLLFNRRIFEHRKIAAKHELEYNLGLLAPLSCPSPARIQPEDFGITLRPEEDARAVSLLAQAGISAGERFVVLHPGSGGSARDWPEEKFGDLARCFDAEKIVVTGTPGEKELAEGIVGRSGGNAKSLAGQTTVRTLAAVLRRSSLCVAHSTGPLHLAVAVGTPVVGIYSQLVPMQPRRWGPYSVRSRVIVPCRPADCRDCRGGKERRCACMESITVNEVYTAARELLSETDPGSAGGR